MYAAGKIPGGFIKREGRPTENATLTSRLTDRPIRPLLPKQWRAEIQVTITTLSTDQENEPEILSIIGASAAMLLSDVPFAGPGRRGQSGLHQRRVRPQSHRPAVQESELELIIAGTADAVSMVEASAHELPEDIMLEAIRFGFEQGIKPVARAAEADGRGRTSRRSATGSLPSADTSLRTQVTAWLGTALHEAATTPTRRCAKQRPNALRAEAIGHFTERRCRRGQGQDRPPKWTRRSTPC